MKAVQRGSRSPPQLTWATKAVVAELDIERIVSSIARISEIFGGYEEVVVVVLQD